MKRLATVLIALMLTALAAGCQTRYGYDTPNNNLEPNAPIVDYNYDGTMNGGVLPR